MKARFVLIAAVAAALVALPAGALGSSSHATTNRASSRGLDRRRREPRPTSRASTLSNTDNGLITIFHIADLEPAGAHARTCLIFDVAGHRLKSVPPATPQSLGADYATCSLSPVWGRSLQVEWHDVRQRTRRRRQSRTPMTRPARRSASERRDLDGTKAINFGAEPRSPASPRTRVATPTSRMRTDDFRSGPRPRVRQTTRVLTKLTLKQTAFSYTPKPAKSGTRLRPPRWQRLRAIHQARSRKATVTCVATIKGRRGLRPDALAGRTVSQAASGRCRRRPRARR